MVEKIDESMEALNKVLFGTGLLTNEIIQEATDLLSGKVPNKWSNMWEGSENPSTWLKGFSKRAYGLKKWIAKLKDGSLLKNDINLAELFHPEIFLNAIR